MQYVEYGAHNLQTIILLHGGGLSWWNYRDVEQLLSDRFHVVLPILDGHADSRSGCKQRVPKGSALTAVCGKRQHQQKGSHKDHPGKAKEDDLRRTELSFM